MGLRSALCLTAALLIARPASAQAYYNLESGRPVRVGDAVPTARGTVDLELFPLRFEQFEGGARRLRSDPKLTLGVAPLTEIDIRLPMLAVYPGTPGARTSAGLGGLAVGALRALTIETGPVPAVALGGEFVIPVGNLAASVGSYSGNLFVTKTFALMRIHLNASAGTWSIRATPSSSNITPCPTAVPPGTVVPPGCTITQPIVPDVPCDRTPTEGLQLACLPRSVAIGGGEATRAAAVAADTAVRLSGSRFMAGIGVDHAFALSSTLVTADFVVERFVDLYDSNAFTAELGLRHQVTPQLVFDAGVGQRFGGAPGSTSVTLAFSYEIPVNRSRAPKGDR
jgi:hypothetical protein